MSKQSLLLVDGDTRSMRVLEVSLRKAGFTVTTAVSVQDALDKLELHAPDLIISETTFPDGDGFELPRRVRAAPDWADIPFIFLTAEGSIENKIKGLELGVDDYLTKPIYIKEIVTRINILLQKRQRLRFEERKDGHTRFAGRVADMPVVDVIQTIEISRKSGVIQFTGERGRQATIYFRDGRVIDAEAGALQGEDAIYRLLTWNEGEFEVVFRTVRRREVITTSSQGLLMEGMRRLDEWSRLLEQLPPLTHRFEVDPVELSTRLGDVPDEHNSILRLMDGKRTLTEVIDASSVGDLECLQAISRLYFEELLLDLDHGVPGKRDTGRPMPLVEVPTPSPIASPGFAGARSTPEGSAESIEDVASGPISLHALERQLDAEQLEEPELDDLPKPEVPLSPRPSDPELDHNLLAEEPLEPPGALMGGYRQSSLRLIDEAVAAAQAIEPSLFTDEELSAAGIAVTRVPTPNPEPAAPLEGRPRRQSKPITVPPPIPPRAKRPSGTAIPRTESFDHEGPTSIGNVVIAPKGGNGVSIQPIPVVDAVPDDEDSVPHHIARDEPSPPPRRPTARTPAPVARSEDSGIRMIGSLGRDRAEASGELQPVGAPVPTPVETQRELVTILPRRITREVPLLPADTAEQMARAKTPSQPPPLPDAARANTPAAGVEQLPPTVPPVEPPRSEPLVASQRASTSRPNLFEGSGVSRNHAGPGLGPILLFLLAAVLGTVAIWFWVKRGEPRQTVTEYRDAGMTIEPIPDAAVAMAVDAMTVPIDAPIIAVGVDAAPMVVEATVDAGVVNDREAKRKEAKRLYDAAQAALKEGKAEEALEKIEASLKLGRTARSFLFKAQVLQKLDRVDDALDAVDQAVESAPNMASAFELRGRILWAAGRKDEARFAFEQFLAIEPEGSDKAQRVRDFLQENH